MDNLLVATIVGALVLVASMVSVELGISVAVIEILFGVIGGDLLGITSTPWIDFIASQRNVEQHTRFRVVAFSLLTPFFFFKGGLNVSLVALAGALPLLAAFFVVKIGLKFLGVFPVALRYLRPHATYTTLLMSTGLTFGTISSLYGLNAGIIDRTQFSVLVTVVILSAVVPTAIAQRLFTPLEHVLAPSEIVEIEDAEFEPPRRLEPPLGSSEA